MTNLSKHRNILVARSFGWLQSVSHDGHQVENVGSIPQHLVVTHSSGYNVASFFGTAYSVDAVNLDTLACK